MSSQNHTDENDTKTIQELPSPLQTGGVSHRVRQGGFQSYHLKVV
jgi:hypothetical protein